MLEEIKATLKMLGIERSRIREGMEFEAGDKSKWPAEHVQCSYVIGDVILSRKDASSYAMVIWLAGEHWAIQVKNHSDIRYKGEGDGIEIFYPALAEALEVW